MARIPDNEIDKIKRSTSLLRLIEDSGIKLKQHGADYLGHCPFHDDKTPSLVVTPKKNLWHCLGACNTGGSVIDWVMKQKGLSFRHAVEVLRESDAASSLAAKQPLSPRFVPGVDDQSLLNQVVLYYHETLKQSPEALEYLKKRGLSGAMIDEFKLGFANRTLGYRLPSRDSQDGKAVRAQLQKIGLFRSSGHEHFTGSIIVPVLDSDSNVVEVYGRKVTRQLRAGTPMHTYLPGKHHGVWNLDGIKGQSEVILCESLIDAMTFWSAGIKNVTASYGVNGFTDDHLNTFAALNVNRVLIAYDRDTAGDKAAVALASSLAAQKIECFRIEFPMNMDANEYVLESESPGESLSRLVRGASWMGEKPVVVEDDIAVLDSPEQEVDAVSSLVADLAADKIEPVAAARVPTSPKTIEPEVKDNEVVFVFGDRRYRIRGMEKNLSYDQLKINVLVSKNDQFHVDTLDLYGARARAVYIKQASVELGLNEDVVKKDLGQVLLKLESLQEKQIVAATQPEEKIVEITDEDKSAALELLKSRDLLQTILSDFDRCGVVGEETNKLVGYLAAVSRKLERPLAVMIQSSSAAGKSSLMEAVLQMMPDEEQINYSAMTGQSLFYMGEQNLKHKILSVAEEEGAERASYALKLLQSEGELTIASTGKDPVSGRMITHEYHVEGPVMIFSTTTAIDIDEELLNRCLVLSVDEGREQTQAIHAIQRQRRTLDGLKAKHGKSKLIKLHRNAQRLLRPLAVINPYADALTFLDDKTRTRRDHEKYLTLIDSIALLHQYQRKVQQTIIDDESVSYIEVTLDDIAAANHIAHDVLGRSLDELPPQTRNLLLLLDQKVTEHCQQLKIERCDYRFTRKDARMLTGWTYDQIRVHMERLVNLEYVLLHQGGRGKSFSYELLYDGEGKAGQPFVIGLKNVDDLTTTKTLGGKAPNVGASLGACLPPNGAGLASGSTSDIAGDSNESAAKSTQKALNGQQHPAKSYRTEPASPLAAVAASDLLA